MISRLSILKLRLQQERHVVQARQRARDIACLLGFDRQEQVRLATATSELTRNAFRYATNGTVEFYVSAEQPQSLVIEVNDSGPGIKELDKILAGEYESSTGLGKGLVGTRRLMEAFDIVSTSKGTRVLIGKALPKGSQVTAQHVQAVGLELAKTGVDPFHEVERQNQELVHTLAELREKQEMLAQVNSELEQTNRGVVALYAELKQNETDLRRISDQLHQVLDVTTDSILSIDREWRVSYLNSNAAKTAGSHEDVVGKDFWTVFPSAVYENSPFVENYRRAMHDGIASDFEAFYPQPLEVWVMVSVRPTYDGITLFFHDITERKRIAAALLQNEKLAVVGRMASAIAHEINNPLESVTNLLYLASTCEDLPSSARDYLASAETELRRASAITNETLRFHKQSTKAVEACCQDLLEGVLKIHHSRLLNSRIRVDQRMRTERGVLCFDGEIRQVLANLIGNAIDAMHPEGGHLLIRGRQGHDWTDGRECLILTVADTGTGIPSEMLQKIFEAFYTTKGISGTGLGLWICQDILNRHQGRIAVRSSQAENHNGTVFCLYLPFIMTMCFSE